MESQSFDEELFITEDDDVPSEASDPLLPQRQKPLEISLDYSKIIEPLNSNPDETVREDQDANSEVQNVCSTIEVQNIVELPTEEHADHKLAEDFEEFMKSKRKNVDEIIGQNVQECNETSLQCQEIAIEKAATVSSNLEAKISDVSTKLPDIIQTVAQGNLEKEAGNVKTEDTYISETFMHVANYEIKPDNLDLKREEITTSSTSIPETQYSPTTCLSYDPKNTCMQNEAEQCEVTHDLPWLCYLGLASGSTLLASYTNMSPLYYVLAWVAISFLSFQFCAKEERVPPT